MTPVLRLPVGLLVATLGGVFIWNSGEMIWTGETDASGSQIDLAFGIISGLCLATAGVLMIRNSWKAPVVDEPDEPEPPN